MLQTINRNQVSVFIMFVPTCCHDSRRAGTCHSKGLELEEKWINCCVLLQILQPTKDCHQTSLRYRPSIWSFFTIASAFDGSTFSWNSYHKKILKHDSSNRIPNTNGTHKNKWDWTQVYFCAFFITAVKDDLKKKWVGAGRRVIVFL